MSHPTQPREPDYRSYCLALLGGLVVLGGVLVALACGWVR